MEAVKAAEIATAGGGGVEGVEVGNVPGSGSVQGIPPSTWGYSKTASTSLAMCHTFAVITFFANACVCAPHLLTFLFQHTNSCIVGQLSWQQWQ